MFKIAPFLRICNPKELNIRIYNPYIALQMLIRWPYIFKLYNKRGFCMQTGMSAHPVFYAIALKKVIFLCGNRKFSYIFVVEY